MWGAERRGSRDAARPAAAVATASHSAWFQLLPFTLPLLRLLNYPHPTPPHLANPCLPPSPSLPLTGHRRRRHGLRPEPRPGCLLQRPQVVPRPAEARHGAGGRAGGWLVSLEVEALAGGCPLRWTSCRCWTAVCCASWKFGPGRHQAGRHVLCADAAALSRVTRPARRTGPGTSLPTTTSSCTTRRWSEWRGTRKNPSILLQPT